MRMNVVIPSLNRGKQVLESVLKMRSYLPSDVGILVVNNGSDKELSEYRQLAKLKGVRCVTEPKRGFLPSFTRCLTENDADIFVVCSDEDIVPKQAIEWLLSLDWTDLAIARGSVSCMEGVPGHDSVNMSDARYAKGTEALNHFGFGNRYLSGIAYNRRYIREVMPVWSANAWKHVWYPHMYLDALLCMKGDVLVSSEPTAMQGHEGVGTKPTQWGSQYSFGARLDQHLVFRDGLKDAVGTDAEAFATGYVQLCFQTFRMVGHVNGPMYIEAGIDPRVALQSALAFCVACAVTEPMLKGYMPSVMEHIQRSHDQIAGVYAVEAPKPMPVPWMQPKPAVPGPLAEARVG